jgi:nucleoside-diphosphate-sugar epimerase
VKVFFFGVGYCALALIRRTPAIEASGTARTEAHVAALRARGVEAYTFDGVQAEAGIEDAIRGAEAIVVSIPPQAEGGPLPRFAAAIAAAQALKRIVYYSTIGVYGDHGGEWVDETTPPKPGSARSRARLDAERVWQKLGARRGTAVAILRLAGIYGPGKNALLQIRQGSARRIVKPGQVFSRIHVADIAQAIDAAFARKVGGLFNVADDEPSAPGDPLAFAAQLLGRDPPPEVPFEEAAPSLSPMALSFWQECRRVRNDKLKRELGVTLLYPTYREGLRALSAAR